MTPKDFIKTWFANIDANRYDAVEKMMDDNHQFNNPMTAVPANKEQHLSMIKVMSTTWRKNFKIDQTRLPKHETRNKKPETLQPHACFRYPTNAYLCFFNTTCVAPLPFVV